LTSGPKFPYKPRTFSLTALHDRELLPNVFETLLPNGNQEGPHTAVFK